MKKTIIYFNLIILSAACLLPQKAATRTEIWLLDPASLGNGFAEAVDHAAAYAYQTNTPSGTRIIVASTSPGGFITLADFTIGQFRYDSVAARRLHYYTYFDKAKRQDSNGVSDNSYGIVLKSAFEYVLNCGLASNICLHICGSPCARIDRPALNLAVEYPGDGTIRADAGENPLGMAHLKSKLSDFSIAWYTTDASELPEESARKLFRYESLAAAWAGARIVYYSADFASTVDASRELNNPQQEEFTISPEPAVIHRYFINELTRVGLPPAMSAAFQSLRASGVTYAVAAGWQTDSDVDLWVSSRSFPSEAEVCYQHTTNPHFKLLGDKTQATGDDFEIVTIDPQVPVDSLKIYLNLYRASQSTSGFFYLMDGDELYKLPFAFSPNSRGSQAQGHDYRDQSPDWIPIDLQQLLAHPVID